MNEIDESKAKERFMLLNFVRLGGLALVLVAIAISQKAPETSPVFTIGIGLAGLAMFFFWPRHIAARWKAEEE